MAHFAEINEQNVVVRVIAVPDEALYDPTGSGNESEAAGQAFIASLGLTGTWKQTSYNHNIRGKYAGIGDTYDAVNDVFVPPAVE
jgi:hypothetical protein